MIKLVIFDIGGVLVDFMEEMYIHYLHDEIMPAISVRRLEKFIMPLMQLMDFGVLSVPELESMVSKHFKIDGLNLKWVQGYRKLAKPRMRELEELNAINKRYRTVILSNISYSRYAEIQRSYLKMVEVKTRYLSCELRMRKPDPHIYEYVLEKEGVKPEEAVFADNQIENVIGAEKVGINAIWYRNHRKLMRDLRALGVTP